MVILIILNSERTFSGINTESFLMHFLSFMQPKLLPSYSCKQLMLLFIFTIQMGQITQRKKRPGGQG